MPGCHDLFFLQPGRTRENSPQTITELTFAPPPRPRSIASTARRPHPQVRLPPQGFETLCAILEDALTIPEGQDGDSTSPCAVPSPSFSSPAAGAAVAAVAVAAPRLPGVSAAYARRFNTVTCQTLGVVSTSSVSGSVACSDGRVARIRSARADLKALAASGRSIGWFLRLASTAVALLGVAGIGGAAAGGTGAGEPGLTRQALVRAAEMLAPDPHAQALRSLSVTQVCARFSLPC